MAAIRKLSGRPGSLRDQHSCASRSHRRQRSSSEARRDAGCPAPALSLRNLSVLDRMVTPPAGSPAVPRALWPNDTYSTPYKDFFFNGEAVVVYHMPTAHTDGDSIVFFRRSDVVSTGDIFMPDLYPFIDLDRGGSVQGHDRRAESASWRSPCPRNIRKGGTYRDPRPRPAVR